MELHLIFAIVVTAIYVVKQVTDKGPSQMALYMMFGGWALLALGTFIGGLASSRVIIDIFAFIALVGLIAGFFLTLVGSLDDLKAMASNPRAAVAQAAAQAPQAPAAQQQQAYDPAYQQYYQQQQAQQQAYYQQQQGQGQPGQYPQEYPQGGQGGQGGGQQG